jgi:hypothetical protein
MTSTESSERGAWIETPSGLELAEITRSVQGCRAVQPNVEEFP